MRDFEIVKWAKGLEFCSDTKPWTIKEGEIGEFLQIIIE